MLLSLNSRVKMLCNVKKIELIVFVIHLVPLKQEMVCLFAYIEYFMLTCAFLKINTSREVWLKQNCFYCMAQTKNCATVRYASRAVCAVVVTTFKTLKTNIQCKFLVSYFCWHQECENHRKWYLGMVNINVC